MEKYIVKTKHGWVTSFNREGQVTYGGDKARAKRFANTEDLAVVINKLRSTNLMIKEVLA